jgi:hypothetical protein
MPRRTSIEVRVGIETEGLRKDLQHMGQSCLVQIGPSPSRLPRAIKSIDHVQLRHAGQARFAGRKGREARLTGPA